MLRSLYQLVELGYRGLGGIVYKATLSGKGGGGERLRPAWRGSLDFSRKG